MVPSVEVKRERVREEEGEDNALVRAAVQRRAYVEAERNLDARWESLSR